MSWQVAAKGCVPEIGAHASLLKQDIVPPQTLLIAHSSPCDARLVHTSATARFLSCADSEDSLPGDSSGPSVENFDPSETRQSLKLLSKKPI